MSLFVVTCPFFFGRYKSHLILHEKHPCFKVFLQVLVVQVMKLGYQETGISTKDVVFAQVLDLFRRPKGCKKPMGYPWEKSPGHEIQTINRFMRFYDNLS